MMEGIRFWKVFHSVWLFLGCLVFAEQQDTGFVPIVSQNYNERINSQLEQHILSYHNQELAYRAYAAYYDRADVALPGFKKRYDKLVGQALGHAQNLTAYANERGGRVRFPVIELEDACNNIHNALRVQEVTKPLSTPTQTVAARYKPHICYFQSSNPDPFTSHKKKKKGSFSKYFSWWQEADASASDKSTRETWLNGLYGLEDALAMEKSISDGIVSLIGAASRFKDPHTRHHLEEYLVNQVNTVQELGDLVTRLRQYKDDENYPLGEYLIDQELNS